MPSANGFSYTSAPPENSVFSVGGGLLVMDDRGVPGDNESYYGRLDAWDSGLDMELRFSARVLAGSTPSLYFHLLDASNGNLLLLQVGYGSVGVRVGGLSTLLPFSAPDQFHEFVLRSAGGSSAYTLWIDGVLHSSGVTEVVAGPGLWAFGDLSPTGGDAGAEIDYIRYSNGDVPEPATGLLALAGLVALYMTRHRTI